MKRRSKQPLRFAVTPSALLGIRRTKCLPRRLRARQAPPADVRQPHFNRGEFFAQLVFYFSSASWPPRAGVFDEPGGHHEFLFPLLDDAPLHETIGDWRHAENHWQTASCRLGLGRYLLGGIELFLYALPARSGVAKCNGDVGHHLLRRGRIFFRRILVARHRGARSCRSAPTTYWYGRFT